MYDDALRPAELRITQFVVLDRLAASGEARIRDLAERLHLEETTLTRSVKLLEARGWVRIRVGDDRRERNISITRKGHELMLRARPLWESAQAQLREQISASVWDSIIRALPKVADACT